MQLNGIVYLDLYLGDVMQFRFGIKQMNKTFIGNICHLHSNQFMDNGQINCINKCSELLNISILNY